MLEEYGVAWSEEQRNEMFALVKVGWILLPHLLAALQGGAGPGLRQMQKQMQGLACSIALLLYCSAATQGAFRASRLANSSGSPTAGAMFWGATAGESLDWDGWQVRLDGGSSGWLA